MKRLVTAVVVFSAMVVLCIAGGFFVTEAKDELASCFEQCAEKEDDKKIYRGKVEKALVVWEEKKTVLYIFLPYDEIEELENNMDELRFFVENSNYNGCMKVCFASFNFLKRTNGVFKL